MTIRECTCILCGNPFSTEKPYGRICPDHLFEQHLEKLDLREAPAVSGGSFEVTVRLADMPALEEMFRLLKDMNNSTVIPSQWKRRIQLVVNDLHYPEQYGGMSPLREKFMRKYNSGLNNWALFSIVIRDVQGTIRQTNVLGSISDTLQYYANEYDDNFRHFRNDEQVLDFILV